MRSALPGIALLLAAAVLTAAHPLEGRWLGGVTTDQGSMQIGLELHDENGTLAGVVKTAHGDWPIKSVHDEKGEIVVAFDNGEGEGRMTGHVTGDTFAGQWHNEPMAVGTFEVKRSK